MTMKNWQGGGPLSNSHSRSVNSIMLRITIRPYWYHCASVGRASCHCMTPSLPAEISGTAAGEDGGLSPSPPVWVEVNHPTQGQPHFFGRECSGAQEDMKCYVFFSDEDTFSGMALPEEPLISNQRKLPSRVSNQCRLTPLLRRLLQRSPKNQLKRSNSQINSLGVRSVSW